MLWDLEIQEKRKNLFAKNKSSICLTVDALTPLFGDGDVEQPASAVIAAGIHREMAGLNSLRPTRSACNNREFHATLQCEMIDHPINQ